MKLSIIIVSYNVKELLKQAVDSLLTAAKNIDFEFFIVDNASKDGTVEMVKDLYPQIYLIANQKNVGFAAANNQAMILANGVYVLIINPDTITQPDVLVRSVELMDNRQDLGGLGVRMLDGGGKYLPESKRGLPTLWAAFCKLSGLYYLFPKSKTFNQYYLGWVNELENSEVDVLCGAFMLLRNSSLKNIGFFDESFFMYGEDIDLSYRLKLAGYRNYYFPEVSITHFKGQSTKKFSINYLKNFYGSMFIFARKHFLKF